MFIDNQTTFATATTTATATATPKRDPRIFSTDSAKAAKASGYGYLNAIHYMAPHTLGGVGNLCSHASPQCIALCLGHYSGQASMVSDIELGTNPTRESRKRKAQMFMNDRNYYMNLMAREIAKLERRAIREDLLLCMRLNGSTDIVWERVSFLIDDKTGAMLGAHGGRVMTLLQLFPHIQFVDYTKNPLRFRPDRPMPANLHLTFSFSGSNWDDCEQVLAVGGNVAVVFRGGLPETYKGHPVIDGDLHDLRHLDPRGGYIVGLSPKGAKAKKDTSGFVVDWQA